MERLVYVKSWKTNIDLKIYCVHNTFKKEVEDLFKGFKYNLRIKSFDDDKSVCFVKNDFNVSDRVFWYQVLNKLKESGYVFTTFVQSRYDWLKKEYLEVQEQIRIDAEKAKKVREQKQQKEEQAIEEIKNQSLQYGWLCNKWGCLVESNCYETCEYNLKYNMNCRPERVKIKKEGI